MLYQLSTSIPGTFWARKGQRPARYAARRIRAFALRRGVSPLAVDWHCQPA